MLPTLLWTEAHTIGPLTGLALTQQAAADPCTRWVMHACTLTSICLHLRCRYARVFSVKVQSNA